MKVRHGMADINKVTVVDRYRVELGDVTPLAESIKSHGLFHPIVVTSDLQLIAGQRRLEACRSLGWSEVPVRIADDLGSAAELLTAERDENTCRKDMTASELYALGKALEELERPKARERQQALGRSHGQDPSGRTTGRGETREVVGKAVGLSGTLYQRLKYIGDRATDGEPEAQEAMRAIDAGTKSVTRAYDDVRTGAAPAGIGNVGDIRSVPRRKNAARHLHRLAEQIKNLGDFAKSLEVEGLTKDEADSIAADLSDGLSAIRNLRNQLRKVSA